MPIPILLILTQLMVIRRDLPRVCYDERREEVLQHPLHQFFVPRVMTRRIIMRELVQ